MLQIHHDVKLRGFGIIYIWIWQWIWQTQWSKLLPSLDYNFHIWKMRMRSTLLGCWWNKPIIAVKDRLLVMFVSSFTVREHFPWLLWGTLATTGVLKSWLKLQAGGLAQLAVGRFSLGKPRPKAHAVVLCCWFPKEALFLLLELELLDNRKCAQP